MRSVTGIRPFYWSMAALWLLSLVVAFSAAAAEPAAQPETIYERVMTAAIAFGGTLFGGGVVWLNAARSFGRVESEARYARAQADRANARIDRMLARGD